MNSANPTTQTAWRPPSKIDQERQLILYPAERYLNDAPSLPPAPTVVTELLTLFRDQNHDVDQVVKLISYEPALTAQILRTCNSACFAGEQPPGDIFEAVSRIGFYHVYCLVASIFGARARSMEGADEGVNVDDLWRHSVAAAVSASVVADEAGQENAVAFTAGLLHDIGKLVLASVEREAYARLLQKANNKGALSVLERCTFGTNHADVGGKLLRRWNLPPEVVAAVANHHQLEAAPPFVRLTAAVQLGDLIAHQLFDGHLADTGLLTSPAPALDALQLSVNDLPRLLAKTQAEMEEIKGMLQT